MNKFIKVYQNQKSNWVSPPIKNPLERCPVLGDKNLSFTVEYIGGFSLCPSYSIEQLRRINYIDKRKVKHKLNWLQFRSDRSVPVRRQVILEKVHNREAML
jgi:hypothetical protein